MPASYNQFIFLCREAKAGYNAATGSLSTNAGKNETFTKSWLKSKKVSWLGYNSSEDGIKPDKDKAEQIQRLRKPENLKELRQLLGIVNYYQKYIPKMAVIAEPLHSLLRKDNTWKWGKICDEALDKIKAEIGRGEGLAPFDTSTEKKVILTTDACDEGLGCVLEQEQADGMEKPVLYWSSKLRNYERNYSISEKEALACVASMMKLRKY